MYMGDLHISKNKCVAQHVIKDGPVCKAAEMIRSETTSSYLLMRANSQIYKF